MCESNSMYLYFNGDDFTNFISFAKTMNARAKSNLAKIVLLHVEDNQLVCRAIDDTSNYIEYRVDLFNSSNLIVDYIAVSINDLIALVKCANSDKFIIRKNLSQYEFNIIGGGWLPFRAVEIDTSKYILDGTISEIGTINSVKLRNAINSVVGYTQDYTYVRDMYIQFNESSMTATSRRSYVITKDKFVNMTLHRDEANLLKSLLKDNFDLSIERAESAVEKIVFIGPKFKYAVIAADMPPVSVTYYDKLENYLKIDCDDLYKICVFSEEYSASKKILGISVKDGTLKISVKNILAAKHVSSIKSKQIGNVEDVTNEAEIPAHALLKVLKLFQDKKSKEINIYISDTMIKDNNMLIIFDDNTQANIDICSR